MGWWNFFPWGKPDLPAQQPQQKIPPAIDPSQADVEWFGGLGRTMEPPPAEKTAAKPAAAKAPAAAKQPVVKHTIEIPMQALHPGGSVPGGIAQAPAPDASQQQPAPAPPSIGDVAPPYLPPISQGALPQSSLGNLVAPGQQIVPQNMKAAQAAAMGQAINQREVERQQNRPQIPQITASPGDQVNWQLQRQEQLEGKIAQAEYDKANPPTGIGHTLATIGNVLGDIFVPNVMSRVPGTERYKQAQEQLAQKELDTQQQLGIQQMGAEAAMMRAQATLSSPEQQAFQYAVQAEGKNPVQALLETKSPNAEMVAMQSLEGKTNPATGKPYTADEALMALKQMDPEQQFINSQIARGVPLEQAVENYRRLGQSNKVLSDRGWPYAVVAADGKTYYAGQAMPADAQQMLDAANQANANYQQMENQRQAEMLNRTLTGMAVRAQMPTTTDIAAARRANYALQQIPNTIAMLRAVGPQAMGFWHGHWNNFVTGALDARNTRFAGLQGALMAISTAVALPEMQGRMSPSLVYQWQKLLNRTDQDPENLIAVLQSLQPYLQGVAQMGAVPTIQGVNPNIVQQPPGRGGGAPPAAGQQPGTFDPKALGLVPAHQ
jgi:hypothetical protein